MTAEEMADLGTGDIVRHKSSAEAVVVMANYGDRVTAVRTFDLTNPDEWLLVMKASHARLETPPDV